MGVYGEFLSDLTGGSNLQPRLVAAFYSAFAKSWFTSVSTAFDIKSAGGMDDLGVQWEDIKPNTKAYHRPDLRSQIFLPEISPHRPTLNQQQDAVWRHTFLSQLNNYPTIESEYLAGQQRAFAFLVQVEDEQRAESRAAAIAWNEVKERYGAQTLLMLLGRKSAPLLKQTERLRKSFEPGDGIPYAPSPEQVFSPVIGGLRLGSKVPYSRAVSRKRAIQPRGASRWARKALLDGLIAVRQYMAE